MPLKFARGAASRPDYPLLVGSLLRSGLANAPDQQIVYRGSRRWTYVELNHRIGRLASMLSALGVREGAVVAVMDWDSNRYLEAYFAVPMMGAVLQTVNVRLSPAQIGYTLRHAGAEVVLVHRDFLPLLSALRSECPGIGAIVVLSDSEGDVPGWAIGEYESLLALQDQAYAFRDFDENAVATTFYTTGTTGDPKGVSFSHRQLVLLALAANAPFGVTRNRGFGADDVYMPLTPMFHVHAWAMPYIASMLGVKQVYPGRYDADCFLDLRRSEGVTFSHCVPTVIQMILDAADRRGDDLRGWLILTGGSALTSELYKSATDRGLEIFVGYGMSETGPLISFARPPRHRDATPAEHHSAMIKSGVPIPLVETRIVAEDMADLPRDGVAQGELILRAPWATVGYVGDEAGSDALWEGGWLHTRDVATIDADGNIHIRDRIKDVIKSGGEWLSSLMLEELIETLPEVAAVSVVGLPDPRWGERPVAVVVLSPDSTLTLERANAPIREAVESGAINRYALLDRLEIVDRLPVTSVGKIDKKALRAAFAVRTSEASQQAQGHRS